MDPSTAFLKAAREGDLEQVRQLALAHTNLLAVRDEKGYSALLLAIVNCRQPVVEFLLSLDPELNVFEAAAVGDSARVDELCCGNPGDATNWFDGWTALHFAAHYGHVSCLEPLFIYGADPYAPSRNEWGATPLHSALANGHVDVARYFLNYLVDPGRPDKARGWTALHYAASRGLDDIIQPILDQKIDVNARDKEGRTALSLALESGHTKIADILRANDAVE